MASLDQYNAPLTSRQAAHLLRRLTFGASDESVKKFTGKTAESAVSLLLKETTAPDPPKDASNQTFHDLPWGYPGVDDTERNKFDGARRGFTKGWWLAQMMRQQENVIEKMTLFWQNHFVSTATDVSDARFIYRQYQLLRKHALGNFKTFVVEITKDPAMLRYLDGHLNTVGQPNENYARELQELFTIGLGNYNEDDVKNAARVLTGWRPVGYRNTTSTLVTIEFRPAQHDVGTKNFSTFYKNKTITGRPTVDILAGEAELVELVDIILAQDQTALFIVRKIYRWFVQADITTSIENEIIIPLAAMFRKDYEIKPVLIKLFSSNHFFEDTLFGSQIKSPLEIVIGSMVYFNIAVPDPVTDRETYDLFTQYLMARAKELQMEVFDQPSVFGWRPYYDTDFYELWINSTTLALRGSYTDNLVKGNAKLKINIDSLGKVKKVSTPSDPVILINELMANLFSFDLTKAQKDYIIDEVLVPGLPRYEWGLEWNNYMTDQGNTAKQNAVKIKIDNMFTYLLRLAEFQTG